MALRRAANHPIQAAKHHNTKDHIILRTRASFTETSLPMSLSQNCQRIDKAEDAWAITDHASCTCVMSIGIFSRIAGMIWGKSVPMDLIQSNNGK
jgi:hypothetical protein